MESLFRCRQPSSASSDGGAAVPGGIALHRLNRETSTDAGSDARAAALTSLSLRGVQAVSLCPAVHVVADFCSDVTPTGTTVLNTHGLY